MTCPTSCNKDKKKKGSCPCHNRVKERAMKEKEFAGFTGKQGKI